MAVQGADRSGREGIFVRDMATGRVYYVPGSDVAAWEMRYSPDGTKLAFMRVFNRGVYFFELPDGLPERLTDFGRVAYWEDDETIVMTDDRPGGGDSYRVPIGGGNPEVIRFVEESREAGYGNILKSGIPGTSRAFGLQTIRLNEQGNSNSVYRLFTADLDSGELIVLDSAAVNPEFVRGGFIVYNVGDDDGKLVVRPIDPATGLFTAQPKDAQQTGESAVWRKFGVSDDGDLVYAYDTGPASSILPRLWRIDGATGGVDLLDVTLPEGTGPTSPVLTADGRTVLFSIAPEDESMGTVHSMDLESGITTQLTFDGRYEASAVSADGSTVYATRFFPDDWSTGVIGVSAVRFRRDAGGSEETLLSSAAAPIPSPDGSLLLVTNVRDSGPGGLSIVDLADGTAARIDTTRSVGMGFSPDGRYVLGINVPTGRVGVHSVDGREHYEPPNLIARDVAWSRDGSQIYFTRPGAMLTRIAVRTRPSFSVVGQPEQIVRLRGANGRPDFDVASDGSVVLVAGQAGDAGGAEGIPTFVWLQHWAAHVKRQFGR